MGIPIAHLIERDSEIVPKEVKSELLVRHICYVTLIGLFPDGGLLVGLNNTYVHHADRVLHLEGYPTHIVEVIFTAVIRLNRLQ